MLANKFTFIFEGFATSAKALLFLLPTLAVPVRVPERDEPSAALFIFIDGHENRHLSKALNKHSTSTVLKLPYTLNLIPYPLSLKRITLYLKRATVPQHIVTDKPVNQDQNNTNNAAKDDIHNRQNNKPDLALFKIRNNLRIMRNDVLHIAEANNRIDNIPNASCGRIKHNALNDANDDPDDAGSHLTASNLTSHRIRTGHRRSTPRVGSNGNVIRHRAIWTMHSMYAGIVLDISRIPASARRTNNIHFQQRTTSIPKDKIPL